MLRINNWTGRFGNNVLQIIRALHYAINNNHYIVLFPKHRLFNSQKIIIDLNKINKITIVDSFFNLKNFFLNDPSPYEMKKIFQTYIYPLLVISLEENNDYLNTLFIHIRGGDIFSSCPHSTYVQPPLVYYTSVINSYENVAVISEDKKNPCVNELLKNNNVVFHSNTLEKDIQLLCSASNLMIGFGTFGFLIYLMSSKLKNIYIPSYFIKELPQGDWGNDVNLYIIDLPDYINVGEWKNTLEQRNFMLTYSF